MPQTLIEHISEMDLGEIAKAIEDTHPESDGSNLVNWEADHVAMNLIHERHSKRDLVNLIRWLILGAPK